VRNMLPTWAQIFYGSEQFFDPPATCGGEVEM
jgi:hypothetical protein